MDAAAAVHRLLGSDQVRDDLRGYVVEKLGDPAAVLVVDETGFVNKGRTSVGVQRQYTGTSGKIDNCQLGVFLAYAAPAGHAFIDRALYLPQSWTQDQARCAAAGVPGQTAFATKPQLARGLLERALDAGVPASWVTADAAYGGDSRLRGWLEQRGMAYVLAVRRTELLAGVDGERVAAEQLAARVPPERWLRISAGQGAKGCRWYDWTQLALQPVSTHTGRWLLVRRSLDDGELAFYACAGPAGTPLAALVRVAGVRWAVADGFQAAKGRVGLDHYEVRRWAGWHRHTILALLAHAFLAVTRAQVASQRPKGGAAA